MKRKLSAFERLVRSVTEAGANLPDACWTWVGSRDRKGYGFIKVDGKCRRVHIVAWEMANGRKVRPGYTVEHECRNPSCWRPSHLSELTRSENTARGNRANPRTPPQLRKPSLNCQINSRVGGHHGHCDCKTVTPVTPRNGAAG